MRLTAKTLAITTTASAILSGCLVVPEKQEPVLQPPVVVKVPPTPTCYEVTALKRVEVKAETKTVVGISLIENPPYDPIEQRTEQEIVTKQAEVYYVRVNPETGNQTEVTNFCDPSVVTGPVGPAPGEALGSSTQG